MLRFCLDKHLVPKEVLSENSNPPTPTASPQKQNSTTSTNNSNSNSNSNSDFKFYALLEKRCSGTVTVLKTLSNSMTTESILNELVSEK